MGWHAPIMFGDFRSVTYRMNGEIPENRVCFSVCRTDDTAKKAGGHKENDIKKTDSSRNRR
jgi:hypothetical protein